MSTTEYEKGPQGSAERWPTPDERRLIARLFSFYQLIPSEFRSGILSDFAVNGPQVPAGQILGLQTVQEYTPALSGGGTPPAIGNGTIAGRQVRIGKMCFAHVEITFGSTSTYGSSTWTITPPQNAADSTRVYTGTLYASDASPTDIYLGHCYLTGNVIVPVVGTTADDQITASVPFAWASGDKLTLDISYEVA